MEREIKLIYLIKEGYRCLLVLLVAGLIGGAGYTVKYCRDISNAKDAVQFASTCSIQLVTADDEDNEWALRDCSEINKAMLLSDEVIRQIAEDKDIATFGVDETTIRSSIFTQAYNYGELIRIIVLTGSQELSDAISQKLEKYSVESFNEKGISANAIQGTQSFGPAIVVIPPDTENVVNLNPVELPSINAVSLAKHFIMGFLALAVVAYIIECILYILRNRIVYPEELEDEGLSVIGIISKENRNLLTDEVISNVILKNRNIKNVAVLQLGSKAPKVDIVDDRINFDFLGNIDSNPMVKAKIVQNDAVVLLLKSNNVTMDRLKREVNRIREANIQLVGIIFGIS